MTHNNQSKKKILALFLSTIMLCSTGAALAACSDTDSSSSSSSSSSSTSTKVDNGIIKNAGFEMDDYKETTPITTSVTSWTRSVNSPTSGSALSSKTASGVVDTTKWSEFTTSNFANADFSTWTEDKAEQEWENMSLKDKLSYYKAWEEANDDDDKDLTDLEFYQSFNVDLEDLPDCDNPKTHDWTDASSADKDYQSNVLMIHNEYSSTNIYKNIGTAQKFTSSTSVTVPAGTSAQFSVWVKTSDLTSTSTSGEPQAAVDKGAYISITNSLGSASLDPLEVKNINTEGVTEHNGWVQYQFYLRGASFTDSTFRIVLGLGQGGGTDRYEYVNGYAFFDDIQFEMISNSDFGEAVKGKTKVVEYDTEKADKIVNTQNESESFDAYAIDFSTAAEAEEGGWKNQNGTAYVLDETWDIAPTTEDRNGKKYTAVANPTTGATYPGLGISTEFDITGVFTKAALKSEAEAKKNEGEEYLSTVYGKHFNSNFIGGNEKVLMLLSVDGAAYTASSEATKMTLKKDEYAAISFFVKTSAMDGATGANATLIDGANKNTIASIDTTTVETTDVSEDTDGWVRCFFFVSNKTDEEKTFEITFGFGPTTVTDTTKSSYATGFAAFTKFQSYTFDDEKAFECASGGSYAKVVTLIGSEEVAMGDRGFDSAAAVPSNAIEMGYANPQNYKGVYSDSDYVTGKNTGNTTINQNTNAGLLNKEHADNEEYLTKEEYKYDDILKALGGNDATWETVFGNDTTQPLVIYNKAASKPYGFIGKETSIAADSYETISLRVKVSEGATAYVYLVDMDDETHQSLLSVDRKLTYWYDDDGNVCVKDPASKDFNKRKDVAFKLQPNGLYKVNPTWSGASSVSATDYYANLSAYEKDSEQNLVVAKGGVSYQYTDLWNGYGNDDIAFYYKNGAYYANSSSTAPVVKNLADVPALTPRYTPINNNNAKQLKISVTGTADNVWQTVTFYIHTGEEAKNYRLEVWNGDRQSKENSATAGSYVIFDAYSPGAVDEKFATLIDQRVEEIDAAQSSSENAGNYFESVFSFYDSAKFLRYDKTADVNKVGNSYESYLSSSNAAGVAYLNYAFGGEYEIYADYSYAETTVTPDAEEDDTDTEEDETANDSMNVWLLVSSIIIAVVLVFAVISLFVRKLVFSKRRKRGSLAKSVNEKKNK